MESNFITTSNAMDTVEPVNLGNIFSFRKFDGPVDSIAGGVPEYSIDFYKNEQTSDHAYLSWRYKSAEERDCDYKNIISRKVQDISEI